MGSYKSPKEWVEGVLGKEDQTRKDREKVGKGGSTKSDS